MNGELSLPFDKAELKHVSWKVIVVWMFRWAAFLFLLVASVAFLESLVPYLQRFAISSILMQGALAILAALFIYDAIRYNGIKYALTDRGVYFEYGILNKKHFIAPYEGIQDIDVETSLLERVLGIGTVIIETAGVSAKKIEESFAIPGVESPRRFARIVIERAAEAKKPNSLEAFKSDLEKLVSDINELKEGLEGVGNSLEFYEDRIKSMEGVISALEAKVVNLAQEKKELAKKLAALQEEQKQKEELMKKIHEAVEAKVSAAKKPAKKSSTRASNASKTPAKGSKSAKKSSASKKSSKKTSKETSKKSSGSSKKKAKK